MASDRIVLVTGGGGFLGNAVVRMLIQQGDKVRTISRGDYPQLTARGVDHIQADLSDADALRKACQGVETVFHVAAKAGVWGPYEDYYRANVQGTRNIIEACRQSNVSRLIYTSSPSVIFNGNDMEGVDESVPYPEHYEAHYPKTKALAEQAVKAAAKNGLPAISLRPHLIWGPGDNNLVPRILARASRLRRVGSGANKVDTVYVDNAARAHLLADEKLKMNPNLSGRVYFISQDAPIPLWEMIDLILKAGGKPPVKKRISPALALKLGATLEWIYSMIGIKSEPPMTRFVANELASAHWFNIESAKRELGYTPLISTEEGLRRLAEWIRSGAG